jgi:sulfur transfer protein SufE
MRNEKITYRLHAVKRMFERKISAEEVRYVLETGEAIEEYPDDAPYPSRLILGCYKGRIIHIVAANNCLDEEIIVITVYEPDPSEWDQECKKRIQ